MRGEAGGGEGIAGGACRTVRRASCDPRLPARQAKPRLCPNLSDSETPSRHCATNAIQPTALRYSPAQNHPNQTKPKLTQPNQHNTTNHAALCTLHQLPRAPARYRSALRLVPPPAPAPAHAPHEAGARPRRRGPPPQAGRSPPACWEAAGVGVVENRNRFVGWGFGLVGSPTPAHLVTTSSAVLIASCTALRPVPPKTYLNPPPKPLRPSPPHPHLHPYPHPPPIHTHAPSTPHTSSSLPSAVSSPGSRPGPEAHSDSVSRTT